MTPELLTNIMIAVSVLVASWGMTSDEGHRAETRKNRKIH